MNKWTCIFLLLINSAALQAQDVYQLLYLFDKSNNEYTLDAPEQFLSERSIQRRAKQGISLTQRDLPISEYYLNLIKEQEVSVLWSSKWLNAVLVRGTLSNINATIDAVPFIIDTEYLAPQNSQNSSALVPIELFARTRNTQALGLQNAQQNSILGVDVMHERGFKGEGMLIAIFDGGFTNTNQMPAFGHLYSENKLLAERNFTDKASHVYQYSTHGTRVASTIAAKVGETYQGIAPEAHFVFCVTEVVKSEYRIEEFYWTVAAEYADSLGVDIINSSLGYYDFDDSSMNYTYSQLNGHIPMITRAAKIASEVGMILVSSAGNEGNNAWGKITAPSDAPGILSVGSLGTDLSKSSFSSIGPSADNRIKPDLVAIGGPAWVVNTDGSIINASGTSFSAPQIAGLVAGVWQAKPELTNLEIIDLLRNTASNAANPDNNIGYGIPSFTKAMGEISGTSQLAKESLYVFPNPLTSDFVYLKNTENRPIGPYSVRLIDLNGRTLLSSNASCAESICQLNLPMLEKGMYLLIIDSTEGRFSTRLVK